MSIVAKFKVNRIGGGWNEWWNMWFNAIIHVEPYHNLKNMIGDVEAYRSFELFVDSSLLHVYEYCMAVVSTCCDV